jgi:hypothetical protein
MIGDLAATAQSVQMAGPHVVKRFAMPWWLKLLGFVLGVALMVLAFRWFPQLSNAGRRENGGRMGGLLGALPVMAILGIAYAVVRGWSERGVQRFEFPMFLDLPGWGVWSANPQALVLARASSTLVLFHWPVAASTEQVLDAIDRDHRFAILEGDDPVPGILELELSGPVPLTGQLRKLGDHAFALMLGPECDGEMLDDVVETYLPRVRPRFARDAVQKWRPLSAVNVATARVLR